jgi:diphthamide synthase (EF-2-diphthine--ammonia ligase)
VYGGDYVEHAACCLLLFLVVCQLAKQKAADIEGLLQRLSDINHDMSGVIAGAADSRSHTLARHRDILQDLTQASLQAVVVELSPTQL